MSRTRGAPVRRAVQVRRTGGRWSLPLRALVTTGLGLVSLAVLAALVVAHVAVAVALVAVVVAAALLAVRTLAPRRDDRLTWVLITSGMIGGILLRFTAPTGGPPPVVSPASTFVHQPWLGPLVLVALLVALSGVHRLVARALTGVRSGDWQDLALVGAAVLAAALTALHPRFAALGLDEVQGAVLVARPVVALLLTATALAAVVLRGRARDRRLELVLAAGACFTAGDAAALLGTLEVVAPSTALDLFVGTTRLVTLCLLATASTGSGAPRSDATPSPRAAQLVVVGVLLSATALVAADHVGLVGPAPVTALGVLAAAVLVAGVRLVQLSTEVGGLGDARRQLLHDDLTGVLNRRGVAGAADRLARAGEPAALVLVDLDAFKEVNDRCGSVVGDEVLRVVAQRLQRVAGRRAAVARLGADEFSLLLPDADEATATGVADRALEAVQLPVTVADRQLELTAAAGVAAVPPGTAAEELRRRAALALLRAKAEGGRAVFDEALDAAARLRERLLDDLRTALAAPVPGSGSGSCAGRVVAHYQPQVDADGTVSGVEALARWEHPELGLLQPFAFIDLAEEHGLMPRLTELVLRQAVRETARWRAEGHSLRVAVNLSASCLDWPDLLDVVDDVLAERLLPPGALVLEVTETGLVSDAADGLRVAADLVARGVELSVDDYGTGYSSLAHLNHLPARELKLDRAFTRQLLVDGRTATIVRATIALAHDLGMRLVAEGVEDEATLHAITEIGCDVTQGYWHSRPLPADELTGWLRRRAGRAITA